MDLWGLFLLRGKRQKYKKFVENDPKLDKSNECLTSQERTQQQNPRGVVSKGSRGSRQGRRNRRATLARGSCMVHNSNGVKQSERAMSDGNILLPSSAAAIRTQDKMDEDNNKILLFA